MCVLCFVFSFAIIILGNLHLEAFCFDDMDHLFVILIQSIDFPNTSISPAIQPQLGFFMRIVDFVAYRETGDPQTAKFDSQPLPITIIIP